MVREKSSQQIDITVGVLALQGGVSEHYASLQRCAKIISDQKNDHSDSFKFNIMEVRTVREIELLDGIIFPGGETTAMSILLEMNDQELLKALQNFVKEKPVWGTCAGLIMLANTINGQMKLGQLKVTNSWKSVAM